MTGELRGESGEDMGTLREEISRALLREPQVDVEFVAVDAPETGLIRMELVLTADSWKAAYELGTSVTERALQVVGVEFDGPSGPESVPGDRHLERAGTQLIPA